MRTISSLIGAATAILILLVAGCASVPTVRVDKDPSVNLRAYKTFAFFEPAARSGPLPPLPFLDPPAPGGGRYTTLQIQHLQSATREQMERQGYVYDEAYPDLRVNAVLHVDDRIELRSYGYIGLNGRLDSDYYRQGMLSVDLVDARRNALVWQGVAEGRIDTQASKDPGSAIEAAVAEIFAVFPDGKRK